MDAVAVGNFDVASQSKDVYFSHTGTWYEYFTGDVLNVLSTTESLSLNPGEYRLYTDVNIGSANSSFDLTESSGNSILIYPNPSRECIHLFTSDTGHTLLHIMNSKGQLVMSFDPKQREQICGLSPGIYVVFGGNSEMALKSTFVITE
jgi:hypothetical protein